VEGRWISSHTYDVKRLRSDQAGREAPGSLSGLRNRPPGANQSRRTGSPPAETENVGDGGPTTTDDGDDMAKKRQPSQADLRAIPASSSSWRQMPRATSSDGAGWASDVAGNGSDHAPWRGARYPHRSIIVCFRRSSSCC